MKLLAIGAHPDDVEIYMAGTLVMAQARGAGVEIAIATDGAAGGTGDPSALRLTRRAEATAAAAMIGVEPHFLDFPDGRLVAGAELNDRLRELLALTQPDLVITHASNDYHGDHRALGDAVRRAASFAVPICYADTMMGVGFEPTLYVDVTDAFDKKIAMLRCHASQDPERFVSKLNVWNGFRAAQANGSEGSYAEAFRFDPVSPFVDIRDLLPPSPASRQVPDRSKAGR